MEKNTFHLISLGCAKNTVDSNVIANILGESGYSFTPDPKNAAYLIVNTCGFIQAARDEAVATIRELEKIKQPGQTLLAVGCMAELFSEQLLKACPTIDGVLGTRKITEILTLIDQVKGNSTAPAEIHSDLLQAQIAPQGASSYLKIADGCGRLCAFCSIPLIKGTWHSRPEEEILADARKLRDMGIHELILIAQDTTAYGLDRGEKDALPGLIEKISAAVPEIPWIRILYAFPGFVSDQLIDTISNNPQVLPYLDIPLQHAHPAMLKRMRRPDDVHWVRETVAKMRERIPGLAIRSTFIVGFPDETEEEFQALYDFLEEMRFDRVGVFPYSFEAGTASAAYGDTVSEKVKQERLAALMTLQQGISHKINRSFIGKKLDVLIEERQGDLWVGRSYRDAPDIDGVVFVEGRADPGTIVPVRIHSAMEYDLAGKMVSKRAAAR